MRTVTSLLLLAACVAAVDTAEAQDSFGEASRQQTRPAQPSPQQPQQQQPTAPPRQSPSQPAAQQGSGANLDQLMQMERQDFGVPATKQLHSGAMHGPTPASIPGGQVITTKGVVSLVQGRQAPFVLLDVLGSDETLPDALPASWAAQGGSFNDQVQQQFGQMLQQASGGNRQMPLVLYCLSSQCWMSYNAALRAINLGYTNVLWYRGGIEAWKMAGMPTRQMQQQGGYPQQPQQYPTR